MHNDPFVGVDIASGKDETAITIISEEKIDAVLSAAYAFGKALSEKARELSKAAYAFCEAMATMIPSSINPDGWNNTFERAVKKLARRERYLRRYRQRGLRMKSRKTRFYKARHKRF